jgi:YfiH family protein
MWWADWPAPAGVHVGVTTRAGGVSRGATGGLNLGDHVGDDPARVATNRARLVQALGLPHPPLWLRQVHGTDVIRHPGPGAEPAEPPVADAAYTAEPGAVLAVLTADCLPVALARADGSAVAIAHAGWRGLAAGVLGATVAALGSGPGELIAWLGPAIETEAFEVGAEVRAAFLARHAAAAACFHANQRGRWQADLAGLARLELAALRVDAVYGGGEGTYGAGHRWYSYRRDPATGRMATLAWLDPR